MNKPTCGLCGVKIKSGRVRKMCEEYLWLRWRKYCRRKGVSYSKSDILHDKCKSRMWKYTHKDPVDTRKTHLSRKIEENLRRRTAIFHELLAIAATRKENKFDEAPMIILEKVAPATFGLGCRRTKMRQKASPDVDYACGGNGPNEDTNSSLVECTGDTAQGYGLKKVVTEIDSELSLEDGKDGDEAGSNLPGSVDIMQVEANRQDIENRGGKGTNLDSIHDGFEPGSELETEENGSVNSLDLIETDKSGKMVVGVNGTEDSTREKICLDQLEKQYGSGIDLTQDTTEMTAAQTEKERQKVVAYLQNDPGSFDGEQHASKQGDKSRDLMNLQGISLDFQGSENLVQHEIPLVESESVGLHGMIDVAEQSKNGCSVLNGQESNLNFDGTGNDLDHIIDENIVGIDYEASHELGSNLAAGQTETDSVENEKRKVRMGIIEMKDEIVQEIRSEENQVDKNPKGLQNCSEGIHKVTFMSTDLQCGTKASGFDLDRSEKGGKLMNLIESEDNMDNLTSLKENENGKTNRGSKYGVQKVYGMNLKETGSIAHGINLSETDVQMPYVSDVLEAALEKSDQGTCVVHSSAAIERRFSAQFPPEELPSVNADLSAVTHLPTNKGFNHEIYERVSEDEEWDANDKDEGKLPTENDFSKRKISNAVIESRTNIQRPEVEISLACEAAPPGKSFLNVVPSCGEKRNLRIRNPVITRGKDKRKCNVDVVEKQKLKFENKRPGKGQSVGRNTFNSQIHHVKICAKGNVPRSCEFSHTTPLKGLYEPEKIQFETGLNYRSCSTNQRKISSTHDLHRLSVREICAQYEIDEKDCRSGDFLANKIINNHRRIVNMQFENVQLLAKYRKNRQELAKKWKDKVAEIVRNTDKSLAESKKKRKCPEQIKKTIGGITDISKIPLPPLPKIGDEPPFKVGCLNALLVKKSH